MKELTNIIKTGTPDEVAKAQKEIEKYWHGILRGGELVEQWRGWLP